MFKFFLKRVKLFFREKRLFFYKKYYGKKINIIPVYGNSFIEENNIRSILISNEGGKIGDTVITSFMFREIKKKYPEIKIHTVLKGVTKEILNFNPYVDRIFDYQDENLNIIAKTIKNENYDLMIYIREKTKERELKFIRNCGARFNIGIDKEGWKLFDLSANRGKDFDEKAHLIKSHSTILKKIGIPDPIDTSYDIFFDEQRNLLRTELEAQFEKKEVVVINPYGASKHRCFSIETLQNLIEHFHDWTIILLHHNGKRDEVEKVKDWRENVIIPEKIDGILDAAVYISISDLVITPDTSIVHVASTYNKSIIVVYAHPEKLKNENGDHFIYSAAGRKKAHNIFCDVDVKLFKNDNHHISVNQYNRDEMTKTINALKVELELSKKGYS